MTEQTEPTTYDLEKLLMSDPASLCFIGDAMEILRENEAEGADVAVQEVMSVVASEVDGIGRSGEETEVEELDDLATTAKRGALLLLTAAWYAEEQARKVAPTTQR